MFTEKAREEDIVRIERHHFKASPDETTIDIANMLIENELKGQLENQVDDAQNFVTRGGETYFMRICTILAVCRLFGEEDKLREGVRRIFVENATDASEDHGPDATPEANAKFVDRMCDAVIHDDFISMLVIFYRQLFLDQPAYGPEDRAKKMRIRFKILRGFKIDSELCGRDITDLAAPPKLRCYGCDDKEEEAKLPDLAVESEATKKLESKFDNYDLTDGIQSEKDKIFMGKITEKLFK